MINAVSAFFVGGNLVLMSVSGPYDPESVIQEMDAKYLSHIEKVGGNIEKRYYNSEYLFPEGNRKSNAKAREKYQKIKRLPWK